MLNYKLPIKKSVIEYQYFENRITRNAGYLITLSQNSSGYAVECKWGPIGNLYYKLPESRYKGRSYNWAQYWFDIEVAKRNKKYRLIKKYKKIRKRPFVKVKKNVADFNLLDYKYPQPRKREDKYPEGAEQIFIQTTQERNPRLRRDAKIKYGINCMVCGFNFDKHYGKKIGKNYIEIHHTKPLVVAKIKRETNINDVIVICSNCHRIIHRKKGNLLNWKYLKKIIKKRR